MKSEILSDGMMMYFLDNNLNAGKWCADCQISTLLRKQEDVIRAEDDLGFHYHLYLCPRCARITASSVGSSYKHPK